MSSLLDGLFGDSSDNYTPATATNIFDVSGNQPSLVQKASGGLSNYLTYDVPGLAALSRSTMQALSPEQAAAVSQAQKDVTAANRGIASFNAASESALNQYGSKVGTYTPTLSDITGYVGTTISDSDISDIDAKSLYDTQMAQQMAQEAFARRNVLSAQEQRTAQQQARESFASAGRLGGNAGVASEILNRENALAARRAEASNLIQSAYTQGIGALQQRLLSQQQRLASQQGRYTQLSSEREREIARRQNLFAQGISAGQQNLQERQLGFNQIMTSEEMKARLREQARLANVSSSELASNFYTSPGLSLLSTPLNLASTQAANEVSASGANAAASSATSAAQTSAWGNIISSAVSADWR